MITRPVASICWSVLIGLCSIFALSSAEFYFFLKADIQPSYARLLDLLVSKEYAYGEGSGMQILRPYWQRMPELNKVLLGVHTCLAAICLVIGPFQFIDKLRVSFPQFHRKSGRVYVALGLIAMVTAIGYLILTPMKHIYGGAPFALGLWGIAILSIYTFIAGVVHACRGEFWQHRTLMALNFCTLMIAPLLRIWWLVLGWAFPELNQMQVHVAVLMFVGAQVVFAAILIADQSRSAWASPGSRFTHTAPIKLSIYRHKAMIAVLVISIAISNFTLSFFQYTSLLTWPSLILSAENFFQIKTIFEHTLWPFALHSVSNCFGLLFALGVLFFEPLFRVLRIEKRKSTMFVRVQCLFLICVIGAALGHFARAYTFGSQWVRGLGGAAFEGTLGVLLILCAAKFVQKIVRNDTRAAREYFLHSVSLLLIPSTQFLFTKILMIFGLSFEDAYLSSAGIISSLHLSQSYHYTVYSSFRKERPWFVWRGPDFSRPIPAPQLGTEEIG